MALEANDNILGGQDAVIRVGIEADMSEILQQATKFNELIKDANDSFNAMQNVITSTTTRMSALNSATLRLVSSARQLRNEYQLIANSTQRITPMGANANPVVGIGNGNLAALTTNAISYPAQGGVASPLYNQNMPINEMDEDSILSDNNIEGSGIEPISAALGGLGNRAKDLILGNIFLKGDMADKIRKYFSWHKLGKNKKAQDALSTINAKLVNINTSTVIVNTSNIRYGLGAGSGGRGSSVKDIASLAGGFAEGLDGRGLALLDGGGGGGAAGGGMGGAVAAGAAGGGIAAAIEAAGPIIGTIVGMLIVGYKVADYLVKGATRYTGMTGATGVFTGPSGVSAGIPLPFLGGVDRSSFVGLQASAWRSGLFNMAVGPGGYTDIQESLLSAGYMPYTNQQYNQQGIKGMRYDVARTSLARLYVEGFQDVAGNTALMSSAIESANISTTSFMSSMHSLGLIAARTNASLTGMTKAITAMYKTLGGSMGASGNWASLSAVTNATAYSNSYNQVLRDGGAVADLGNFTAQIMMMNTPAFQNAGINLQNRYLAYSTMPGMAQTLASAQDQAIDQVLAAAGFGGMKNMPYDQAEMIVRNNSYGVDFLKGSSLVQSLVGPDVINNTNAFIEWVTQNAIGNPQSDALQKQIQQSGANRIQNYLGPLSYMRREFAGSSYAKAFNQFYNAARDGLTAQERAQQPIASAYYDYIDKNQSSIGWLDSVLANGDAANTWVKYQGQTITLSKFMKTYGHNQDALNLMASGQLQVAVGTNSTTPPRSSQFSEAFNLGSNEKTVNNMTASELQNTFKNGLGAWAKEQNKDKAQHLKVDVIPSLGSGIVG